MNAVLGAAALLRGSVLTERQSEQVQMLESGGEVLMRVLDDILDFSKLEAGKLEVDPQPVDLDALIQTTVAAWLPRAEAKGLALRAEVEAPPRLRLDGVRVGQIVHNLVSNAIKFTAVGEIVVQAQAVASGAGTMALTIHVRDTGIGMGPEVLQRLFSAFEQAERGTSRQFGGTGLGLAISRKLARLMEGDLVAQSVAGAGLRFSLTLPTALAADADPDLPSVPAEARLDRALRILVAEDNPANQRVVALFLEAVEAELTIVGDGRAALDALAHEAFDLVLMDMQMPVMGGLEAVRRLRASAGVNRGVPVLALTANAMAEERRLCLEAGMNGHVAKPINPTVLLNAIAAALASDTAAADVAA